MPELVTAAPLTKLTEEEELFRHTVRDFAEREVRPRVAAMERAAALDPALLAKFFELGLMGIEIGEQYGGAGGDLPMNRPARAAASPGHAPPPRLRALP